MLSEACTQKYLGVFLINKAFHADGLRSTYLLPLTYELIPDRGVAEPPNRSTLNYASEHRPWQLH
jgi:hypothetical protein